MGTWGYGSFENDDALDWLAKLDAVSQLDEALDVVIKNEGGYIEAGDGWMAVAASEVVAALNGQESNALPEETLKWVSEQPRPDAPLLQKARQAVDQVLTSGELSELWGEDPQNDMAWRAVLDDLKRRLNGAGES